MRKAKWIRLITCLGVITVSEMPEVNSMTIESIPDIVQEKQKEVKGRVIDAVTGDAIIGASVIFKNTKIGTSTDVDGNFILKYPGGTQIVIVSYMGYKTKEITVKNAQELTFNLEENLQELDEAAEDPF